MKNLKNSIIALVSILALNSCNSDDPVAPFVLPVNEEEVITTIKLTSVPVGGGTDVTYTWKDLDGDGPNAPTFTLVGGWVANKTYRNTIEFLDESATPVKNITDEVIAEGVDHQVFYESTGTFPNFTYFAATNSTDANGRPIGIATQLVFPSGVSQGAFKITLRHQPNKTAAGVSTGDITNAGGSTDVEFTSNNFLVN